jgi:hypothetical protein
MKTCHCHGRGWYSDDFLDQLYCECDRGKELKRRELASGRLSDDEMLSPIRPQTTLK